QHLNISTDATDGQLHELVETGLTGSSLQGLRAIGIVNIDVQPLQSSDARLSNSESDYLYRIAHILALAESFCGDVEKAKCWLSKPKSQFSGRMPIEMLSTTPGTNRVEELLTQAKEGMLLLGRNDQESDSSLDVLSVAIP
ncbi:antitoxin Xre/MbcA/ParS toxin-binding domain-containing protein, partial [Pseudomonas syringae group genomosp. 3]